MRDFNENDIALPLISAFCIHLLFFMLISYAINNFKNDQLLSKKYQNLRPLKIERISKEQMKKYRTVGKQNGSKKAFSMPSKGDPKSKVKINGAKKIAPRPSTAKISVAKKVKEKIKMVSKNAISFKSLKPVGKIKIKKLRHLSKDLKISKDSNIRAPNVTIETKRSIERQKSIKKDLMNQLGPGSVNAQLANKSEFKIQFETPEGVNEDELNSAEKMYYSFQKRTFESYFHSFLKSYNERLRSHPQLKKLLQVERHKLTGRVTFDDQGNIVSIKMLKWSQSDEVQNLFEATLKEIRSLPNPPRALLQRDSKQLNIYYQLQIN
ncbi:MAG: hypothetical protein HN576_00150 [Bacteriovoracaceae bacterium]|jgi:hypothetical protein|nr:hypothetical protein [Bacteriovoracaceae bacterium]